MLRARVFSDSVVVMPCVVVVVVVVFFVPLLLGDWANIHTPNTAQVCKHTSEHLFMKCFLGFANPRGSQCPASAGVR